MVTPRPSHVWLRGARRTDRQAQLPHVQETSAASGQLLIDAHRRLRGPYTAAGTIIRAITAEVLEHDPQLVRRYDIELLSVAPELSDILPNSRQTLTSMALPTERTRFYARLRTRRIANGLVEFIRDAPAAARPQIVVIENVDEAESTDVEFFAAALRRLDPSLMQIVVCTRGDFAKPELAAALIAHTRPVDSPVAPFEQRDPQMVPVDRARAYIASDGTNDDPELIAAYTALPRSSREELHDERAVELGKLDERTLRLGAIPYHLEHGSDPAAGATALYDAQDYALCLGFYEAVVDYGNRGLALIDAKEQPRQWWMFAIELGLALSILSRTREALAIYDRARLLSTDPTVHMAAAYSTAMLYTRHNDPEERDGKLAKSWLNAASATASLILDPSERAFQSAFYRNGLALVEVNLGRASEALRLVEECIDMLDRDLGPDEHRLHRSVLKNNRARVYSGLSRPDDALADYAVVIDADPNHAEHYLERGNILRRLGRFDEAFADYETAHRLSPPFPEIYYNRGDLRLHLGDVDAALADFDYVLELDPSFLDAYINRAGVLADLGNDEAARRDVAAGLQLEPDNAHLLAVLGQLEAEAGDEAASKKAFDAALRADPTLQAAWTGRAILAYQRGDHASAIDDLDAALDLGDTPELRFNRATVLIAAERYAAALADLERALELDPTDDATLTARDRCRRQLVAAAR